MVASILFAVNTVQHSTEYSNHSQHSARYSSIRTFPHRTLSSLHIVLRSVSDVLASHSCHLRNLAYRVVEVGRDIPPLLSLVAPVVIPVMSSCQRSGERICGVIMLQTKVRGLWHYTKWAEHVIYQELLAVKVNASYSFLSVCLSLGKDLTS